MINAQMQLDKSEPTSVFAQIIHEFGPNTVLYQELAEGDVRVQTERGLVLIERKRPDDLIASIQDGRLFSQVTRMFAKTKLTVVAIDGELNFQNGLYVSTNNQQLNFSQVSLAGALFRAQLLGAYIYPGGNRPFGAILRSALDLITTLPIRTKHEPITPSPDPATQAKIDYLAALPNIGAVRAFNLVKRFTRSTPLFDLLAVLVNAPIQGVFPDNVGEGTVNTVRAFLGIGAGEIIQRARIVKRKEWREFDSKSKGGTT